MSKAGVKAPPSVDPSALATAQTGANTQSAERQAALNNVGVASPFGVSSWGATATDPTTGLPSSYRLNQQLNPTLQGLFDQNTSLLSGGYNTWGGQLPQGPVSTDGLPALVGAPYGAGGPIQGSVNSNFPEQIAQAQKAAYNTQTGFLDPQFKQKESDLEQQLADQGLSPGTEAYDRAKGDLGRQETLAYQQAQNEAVSAGNQEQSTLFGESLGAGQFANQAQQQGFGQGATDYQLQNAARGQGFNERLAQWGEPLSELEGIGSLGLGAVGTLGNVPSLGGTATSVSPTNVVGAQGAANTGNLNSFLAGNTLNNQLGGGIGTIGSALGNSNLLFGSNGLSSALGISPTQGLFGGLFGGGGAAATAGTGGLDAAGIAALLAAPVTGV